MDILYCVAAGALALAGLLAVFVIPRKAPNKYSAAAGALILGTLLFTFAFALVTLATGWKLPFLPDSEWVNGLIIAAVLLAISYRSLLSKCSACHGTGSIPNADPNAMLFRGAVACDRCEGTGQAARRKG